MQHYLLFLALVVVFSFGVYQFVVPSLVKGSVMALFKPHDERLAERFTEVTDNVYAVTTDKFSSKLPAGTDLKQYIKTDYIFDFSNAARGEKKDGYTKGASEWVVKASGEGGLGEAAIILEPPIGFAIIAIVFGFALAILVTFFLPSSIGYMAQKVDREIGHTKSKIRLQTGFSDEIVDLLTMPDGDLAKLESHQVRSAFKFVWDRTASDDEEEAAAHGRRLVRFEEVFTPDVDLVDFRQEVLLLRIKEFFSDFVVKEIVDCKNGIVWSHNRLQFFKGLRLYMSHHF